MLLQSEEVLQGKGILQFSHKEYSEYFMDSTAGSEAGCYPGPAYPGWQ